MEEKDIIKYEPSRMFTPAKLPNVPTAWRGLESIIASIIEKFNLKNEIALEFGVDYGYSTGALANFFNKVIGVDTFLGDKHAGARDNLRQQAENALKGFDNIELITSSFEDFIKNPENEGKQFDLIHIDIVHDFQPTYDCGSWAVKHAPVVIFHDTDSFPEVRQAVMKIAEDNALKFYNYPNNHGLGILVKE